MLPLFDLHCDTLSCAYEKKLSLFDSSLHASFDKSRGFYPYCQVMAIWTNDKLSDSAGFKRYLQVIQFARENGINFDTEPRDLSVPSLLLAIEDLRIIENDISRLELFYRDGVRIITPMWRRLNVIGGAWDTDMGLTDFGHIAVKKMLDIGITIDLSHASERSFYDILYHCASEGKIPIASHSNSFSVCRHRRNLKDTQIIDLIKIGAIIGVSLAPEHLNDNGSADIADILKHIEHYLKLGATDNLCLGCDFDGVDALPNGINDISELEKLYFSLEEQFGKDISDKIFFKNSYEFAIKNLFD